jgi:Leucine-rich repeat (LRR) protein
MSSKSNTPVHFVDANLEEAVRCAFVNRGRPLPEIIEARHLSGTGFTHLDASHCEVERLDGLEHCTDLRYLELSYNRITDLTPLSGLTQLEDLFLGIGDFEAAPGGILCTEAESFRHTNRIVDLTPLEKLSKLHYLDLAGNNELEDIGIVSQI